MKILVTGGAGFIGSVTTQQLVDLGHNVLVYDSLINGHRDSVKTNFVQGCLSNKKLLDSIFKRFKPDAVLHFAGFIEAGESMINPNKFFGNNVLNGVKLLDTMIANNVRKIIYSSSAGVYKPNNKPLAETSPTEPVNFYGETKLIFERILKWYDQIYGIKYFSLRYFNAAGCDGLLGERHNPETHLIPLTLFSALGKRENIKIFGTDYKTHDGTCVRDYINVKDLAKAHILALNNLKDKSEVYNVGTGKGISVKQLINLVKDISGKDFPVVETEKRPGDPDKLVADSSKIKKELKWKPEVNFKQGLEETYDFFKKLLNR